MEKCILLIQRYSVFESVGVNNGIINFDNIEVINI